MASHSYPAPRRIWAEDDVVYAEAHDGRIVTMSAEVALSISRQLGTAGGTALMNRMCPLPDETAAAMPIRA